MYVITDYALYHMVADDDGTPRIVWKETYLRSNTVSLRQHQQRLRLHARP